MINVLGVLSAGRFTTALEYADFVLDLSGHAPLVRLINYTSRETVSLTPRAGALAADGGAIAHLNTGRLALYVDGMGGDVTLDAIAAARMMQGQSVMAFLNGTTSHARHAVELMALDLGTGSYLLATCPMGSGLEVFRLNMEGASSSVSRLGDDATRYLDGVSSLASLRLGNEVFVYAGSTEESGISGLRLGANGQLSAISAHGPLEGVPMNGVSALTAVAALGQNWLIAAGFGSSSLTVFHVEADGSLRAVDHILDGLASRFAATGVLESIVIGERIFVAAAGADDGISLFTLLPDGRLIHLESLADSFTVSLANISALQLVALGGRLQILAVSGQEIGMTVMEVDLRNLGDLLQGHAPRMEGGAGADLLLATASTEQVLGGAGDDILVDARASQSLSGGTGADLFVLMADGVSDTITDFEPSRDRLDLSAWTMFRSPAQLTFTPSQTGGVLTYGAEHLVLLTANGQPLTAAQMARLSYGTEIARYSQFTPLEAAPPPAPVTTPPERPVSPPSIVGRLVAGTAGDDVLQGSASLETYRGYGGDDTLLASGGADRFEGGAGVDWVSYQGFEQALVLDLEARSTHETISRGHSYDGIEGIGGTNTHDRLMGGGGSDRFQGNGGVDRLYGRGGNDLLYGGTQSDYLYGASGDDSLLGGEGDDSLYGGDDSDTLSGAAGADVLQGGAGQDVLHGGTGRDILLGGSGDDLIYGSDDADRINGDTGQDRLYGGAGADALYGGANEDRIWGGNGADLVFGGTGADLIYGEAENDRLSGSDGADQVFGGFGDDSLWGGGEADRLFGGAGADYLMGEAGADRLSGGGQVDVLFGGTGEDSLFGDGGDDRLYGGVEADLLIGGEGHDLLLGESGHDIVYGQSGADRLYGAEGSDRLFGGDDFDLLDGGGDRDYLFGGAGNDILRGGAGSDWIEGGAGKDRLYGGANADRFVIKAPIAHDIDWIMDFKNGEDVIELGGIRGADAAARFANLAISDALYGLTEGVMIRVDQYRLFIEGARASQIDLADFVLL